jgi:hypothetical protein
MPTKKTGSLRKQIRIRLFDFQEKSVNAKWSQIVKSMGLVLCLGVSMSAEAELSGQSIKKWQEEVLLHNGQKIVAERSQNLGGRPTLESRERQILDETITFSIPASNQRVTWKMNFRDDTSDLNGINVVLIDIVKDVPYIAGYPTGCIAYNKWKRPNPPQILFKYEGGAWKRVALTEFPTPLVRSNVIVGGPPAEGIRPFYTTDQVDRRNYDINAPEYKTVLREEIKNAGQGCPELVRVEGGWRSPGGAKSPIPISPRNLENKK